MRMIGPCCLALGLMTFTAGCMTGAFHRSDSYSNATPGSSQWWAEKAALQPGVRNNCKKGKIWPARHRPTGDRQQFSHTFHAAHYWPLPYVCQDRQYVKDIMELQTNEGWQQETTLYDRHFDPETQMLTRPGELHLSRILDTTPLCRRNVFVQASCDGGVDSVRVSNVQAAVAALSCGQGDVPVTLRHCREYGRPASEVQQINDLYNQSIPIPRISGASASAGGGGTAGGAGGAVGP